MTDSTQTTSTQPAAAGANLATNSALPNTHAVPTIAALANTKDAGRVRIGGASIRF